MTWAIQASHLKKSYPQSEGWRSFLWPEFGALAVDDVSVSVRKGELFGLVGPNGAGKTTLIKILTTLVLPTSGKAVINGYPLQDEINVKRSVGLVTSDERSFFWRLNGRQNLNFFAALNGLASHQVSARVGDVLDLVGLTTVADKRFSTYSTGMRQRLSIGRALLSDPQILFLDEPTKGLDPAATNQLRELIRTEFTRERGLTVFLTSHRLDEVERICDRVAVMVEGKIQACGTMGELRALMDTRDHYRLQFQGWSPEIQTGIHQRLPDLEFRPVAEKQNTFSLVTSRDTNALDEVVDYLRERGCKLREIAKVDVSLDEIFRQFTQEGTDQSATAVQAVAELELSDSQPAKNRRSFWSELLRVAGAFLRRDFQMEISYKVSFFLQFFSVFISVAVFYFVAELFGQSAIPYLEPYGGDYFSFVLIGIAFGGYFGVGLSGFSNSLRRAQTTGTLEAMLSTPSHLSSIILSSSQWSYLMTTFRVIIYILVGVLFLNVNISGGNIGAALLVLLLTIISFSSLGIIAASFIMVIKRGDPITWVFGTTSSLLGGVYYPTTVMPEWMQFFANLLPMTYALRAIRLALLQDAGFDVLWPDVLALLIFCVVLLPLSLILFRYAVRRARVDGSLTHY